MHLALVSISSNSITSLLLPSLVGGNWNHDLMSQDSHYESINRHPVTIFSSLIIRWWPTSGCHVKWDSSSFMASPISNSDCMSTNLNNWFNNHFLSRHFRNYNKFQCKGTMCNVSKIYCQHQLQKAGIIQISTNNT